MQYGAAEFVKRERDKEKGRESEKKGKEDRGREWMSEWGRGERRCRKKVKRGREE